MHDTLQFRGSWFLPESPNQKITGTLHFSRENGASLELEGVLAEAVSPMENPEFPVVLGELFDGKQLTVLYASETRRTFNFPGAATSTVTSFAIIQGAHFDSAGDGRFSRMFAHYDHLEDWVAVSGISVDHTKLLGEKKLTIAYAPPAVIMAPLKNGWNIAIRFTLSIPTKPSPLLSVSLEQGAEVEFAVRETAQLERFLEQIRTFQNFLSLGVGAVCEMRSLQAETSHGQPGKRLDVNIRGEMRPIVSVR